MNKRKILLYTCLFIINTLFLTSCIEDELAFDVIESPVLAVFEEMEPASGEMFKVKATFYELDKSGILDNSVGIDSMPISNLSVQVFVLESSLVEELTTDASGAVIIERNIDDLLGSSRLEWVGNYKEVPFRIYKNL